MSDAPSARDDRRSRTVDGLLDAAATVFADQGYHATSVDAVAAAAGYTKGDVYSNFASKEELFLALVDRHIDQAVDVLEEVLRGSEPDARATAVGKRRDGMAVFDPQWHLLELEFVMYAARNESVRNRMAERQQRTRERIGDIIGRHLDDLGADSVDAHDVAKLLIAASDGLTVMGLIDREEGDLGRLMGLAIELMTRGVVADHG